MKKANTTERARGKRKGFTKKIGSTTYDVSFHYSRQSRESMKMLNFRAFLDILHYVLDKSFTIPIPRKKSGASQMKHHIGMGKRNKESLSNVIV